MSTIFKTRISQQEVQAPTVSAGTVVTDNFVTSSIQSESVASENINATTVQGEEIIANDLSTENIAISNDLSIGQDVIVPSGNVLVGRKGIVSFVDDGEEVDENGASGFPIYNGVPEVLNNSTVYNIGEIDKDIDLSNIRFGGNDNMVQTCEIWLSTPADTYEITWPENVVWLDSTDGNAPAIVKGTEYRIVLRKENEQIVASIAYAIGEGQQNVDEMIRDAAQKDGDNTFSGANTFTGSVDMSTAQVTPPGGWNVKGVTAEQVQAVAPIAFGEWTTAPVVVGAGSIVIGNEAVETHRNQFSNIIIGEKAKGGGQMTTVIGWSSSSTIGAATSVGAYSAAGMLGTSLGYHARSSDSSVAVGEESYAEDGRSMSIGSYTHSKKKISMTIGSKFTEKVNGENVTHPCTTEGTGSITIGAGANTLNNGDTESSNSVTIGCKASNTGADSVVIGAQAQGKTASGITLGAGATTSAPTSITLGSQFTTITADGETTYTCSTEGAGSITIGAGANTKNTTKTVGGEEQIVESSNSVTIGCKAENKGADSVVIGASASGKGEGKIVIGAAAGSSYSDKSITIGNNAQNNYGNICIGSDAIGGGAITLGQNCSSVADGVSIGRMTHAQSNAVAIGVESKANADRSVAIGKAAQASDYGVVVFRSTSEDLTKTQLYFSGANTPLANTYTNGEALMGFVTSDKDGNPVASGYKRLSAIFDEGSMTQPASLDENGEWVMPKVFHPSDLDLPVEEPSEPEDVEITIPDSVMSEIEEYIPLPVYPIVEPEIEEL